MALASVQAFQFGEDGKLARDSCLAVHFVFGLLLGVYSACTVLSDEIKNGTASFVLSKPVSREIFFLSKFFGITIVVILFSACAIAASLLGEHASPKLYSSEVLPLAALLCAVVAALVVAGCANYFFDRPFPSTAFTLLLVFMAAAVAMVAALHDPESGRRIHEGRIFMVNTSIQWRLIPAGLLVTMALITLSGVALALAGILDTIPVLIASASLFFAGLLSDYIFGYLGSGSMVAEIGRLFLPNWQYFWLADALTSKGTISASYLVSAAAYAICFLSAILAIGMLLFRHQETK